MPGETDVINVSLGLIGATAIVSLTDGSESANRAGKIYTEVRDSLLRSHPWNFATKRQKLAQSSTDPVFEFDRAYPLPSDWLRTVSISDNDAGWSTVLFRMEQIAGQNAIICSREEIWLRYVHRVTDPNLMTADFRTALEFLIARDLAIPLTSSRSLRDDMSVEFKAAKAAARSSDAMGSFPELRPRGSWASARGGRRRNNFLND